MFMDLLPAKNRRFLETFDLPRGSTRSCALAHRRLEVLRVSREIGRQTKAAFDERQREVLLREQSAPIQRQLGEGEERKARGDRRTQRGDHQANMPRRSRNRRAGSLRRCSGCRRRAAEYWHGEDLPGLADRAALEPAAARAPIDIAEARRILDEDHYGLEKIKRRIIEYLAVRKLAPQGKAPILCFVGPPGVGKTSLGQSIAEPWVASSCA